MARLEPLRFWLCMSGEQRRTEINVTAPALTDGDTRRLATQGEFEAAGF
jgi:hypothetical protein